MLVSSNKQFHKPQRGNIARCCSTRRLDERHTVRRRTCCLPLVGAATGVRTGARPEGAGNRATGRTLPEGDHREGHRRFHELFLREDITWNVVYTDDSVKRYNANLNDPAIPRATKIQGGSPRRFIESIARSRQARSEAISNVRIDTDGEVAQVWFDFAFIVGDYKSAWGKESWQLVRTGDGWKIAAVVWSAEENPVLH